MTGPTAMATFRATDAAHGVPASTLTLNGMVFTTGSPAAKNGRPNHLQTQGTVERFQQTMKKWLRAQPDQPTSVDDLQTAARTATTGSATTRSTRSAASPCASPADSAISASARTHARTDVILLVHDLHVTIANAATGENLRDLIIDPRLDYQPTG